MKSREDGPSQTTQLVPFCSYLTVNARNPARLHSRAGELNFNIVGVAYQLTSIASESIRLVMVQILLQVGRGGAHCLPRLPCGAGVGLQRGRQPACLNAPLGDAVPSVVVDVW